MCFVLCKLQPLLTYLLLHDVLRSSVLWSPPWEALPQSLTHSGWTKVTFLRFTMRSCGFTAAANPENSSAARRFHGEEPAYVMAEHCRASEKRMLRGATAIKGVWAIGKPPGGRTTRFLKQHLHLLATFSKTRTQTLDPLARWPSSNGNFWPSQ